MYMKFCEHCGNKNEYMMPYCTHCGHLLFSGDSLNYAEAKTNFESYLKAHADINKRFQENHFQLCSSCQRKCLLSMDYCPWCGRQLNHQDQYDNCRMIITTSNNLSTMNNFTLLKVVSTTLPASTMDLVKTAEKDLGQQSQKLNGNTVIGFRLCAAGSSVIAYGTAALRRPSNGRMK